LESESGGPDEDNTWPIRSLELPLTPKAAETARIASESPTGKSTDLVDETDLVDDNHDNCGFTEDLPVPAWRDRSPFWAAADW
jgi:hypothetical protein